MPVPKFYTKVSITSNWFPSKFLRFCYTAS
jgi:hypothetical protein